MQFRDKTAYVWGLCYRWVPSLSMIPARRIAHFMPPWLRLSPLWAPKTLPSQQGAHNAQHTTCTPAIKETHLSPTCSKKETTMKVLLLLLSLGLASPRSPIAVPAGGYLGAGSNNQNGNLRWFSPWRGGGLEFHIPILKNYLFENHLESFPDCENVFCT